MGCDMDLTLNEKRLLVALEPVGSVDAATLADLMDTRQEAVIQYANLARERRLVDVEARLPAYTLTEREGGTYAGRGLPERQVLEVLMTRSPCGICRRTACKRWRSVGCERRVGLSSGRDRAEDRQCRTRARRKSVRSGSGNGAVTGGEGFQSPGAGSCRRWRRLPTPSLLLGAGSPCPGLDLQAEVGTLTRDQIRIGRVEGSPLRRYDVTKVPSVPIRERPTLSAPPR